MYIVYENRKLRAESLQNLCHLENMSFVSVSVAGEEFDNDQGGNEKVG